jgi:hypothetical protein
MTGSLCFRRETKWILKIVCQELRVYKKIQLLRCIIRLLQRQVLLPESFLLAWPAKAKKDIGFRLIIIEYIVA